MKGGNRSRDARILIVEDERLIALDEQNRLVTMGYENVSLASSEELAADRVRRESPDLVLMNVDLTGELSGPEAAALIRSQCSAPIVFVSAYRAEKVGVTDTARFLRKPFSNETFRRAVENALS